MNEAEKDVLGADVGVIEKTRLFLGENNNPAGPVCKTFEQWDHPVWKIGGYLLEVYRCGE